jgi:hypothetical protein
LRRFWTPEWLTAIGTVGATLLALLLAGWGWISAFFFGPKLQVQVSENAPYWDPTKWGNGLDVHYFRLSIENKRTAIARGVHVFVESVELRQENGGFVPAPRFRSMFLKWAHLGGITMPALWKGMPRFCDLLHVTRPSGSGNFGERLPGLVAAHHGVLALDLEKPANSLGHLLEPGEYLLKLKVAAENYAPRIEFIELKYDGVWLEGEAMLRHIKIRKR